VSRRSFGVFGTDPRARARSVFLNSRRRAPGWTNQGVRLTTKLHKLTLNLDQLMMPGQENGPGVREILTAYFNAVSLCFIQIGAA
jgi:hypothetical protein